MTAGERKREEKGRCLFTSFAPHFSLGDKFVIIVNLRLRSVGGNEIAIGQRFYAKILCKEKKRRISRARKEKRRLER